MKVKNIHEPVFNTHLLFIYDCKAFEAEDYLKRKGIRTQLTKCTGQTGTYKVTESLESEQTRYYMYIEKGKATPELIAHEASHLIFFSLFDCGIRIEMGTDEVFCYYLDWWIEKLNTIL